MKYHTSEYVLLIYDNFQDRKLLCKSTERQVKLAALDEASISRHTSDEFRESVRYKDAI